MAVTAAIALGLTACGNDDSDRPSASGPLTVTAVSKSGYDVLPARGNDQSDAVVLANGHPQCANVSRSTRVPVQGDGVAMANGQGVILAGVRPSLLPGRVGAYLVIEFMGLTAAAVVVNDKWADLSANTGSIVQLPLAAWGEPELVFACY